MPLRKRIPERTPPIDSERKRALSKFQKRAGLRFRNLGLLNLAFVHRSYANEDAGQYDNNEKLEFLGDAVLGLLVSEYLYRTLPDQREGDLARIKSFVVSESGLATVAAGIAVERYLLIGRGEEQSGGRQKKAIVAAATEAIIGALHIDSGLQSTRRFVERYFVPEINKVLENRHQRDYKTLLQEYVQKRFKSYPRYNVSNREGPDHDRTFWVEVSVNDRTYGPGRGKNKKEAEQDAAEQAFGAITGDAGGAGFEAPSTSDVRPGPDNRRLPPAARRRR